MTNIDPTLDLFTQFREATGGDTLTASLLTLAHLLQEGQIAPAKEPAPPLPTERMLTMEEAAEYLGTTRRGLQRVLDRTRRSRDSSHPEEPTLRFFQTAKWKPIRFKREWLDQFIQENTIMPIGNQSFNPQTGRRTAVTPVSITKAVFH